MTETQLPFTHEMVVVHKVFRREFGMGPEWIGRVDIGDTAQAAVVYGHLLKVFEMLHHHHEAEDINLWPRLRDRAADHHQLLDDMQAQHTGIDPALERARELGQRWVATAGAAERAAFAESLSELAGPLMAHLDQEEAEILPLAQRLLSAQEWALLGTYAMEHTPKADLLKGLGGILEDATPDERELMLAEVPAMPKLLYRLFGKRSYIKEATAVRGKAPVGL